MQNMHTNYETMNGSQYSLFCFADIYAICWSFLSQYIFRCRRIRNTMVEEIINPSNKPKNKTARPRPVYLWNVLDVQKWLRRHCSDYYQLYHEKFLHHDITGRVLLRINENILLRLGVDNEQHRMDIWREIMKLHLKTDMLEIRDIERRNNMNFD